mmetsp:Transcript_127873/g.239119  ORF Transcript_127873/g.239119 Transcript_127873/m.239119 type:complete len:664 (+) Transcript_127873:110-2101(+)
MAPDRALSGDSWGWMCMLRGFVNGPKVKAVSNVAENILPVPVIRSGGDCGPTTAAWLLNEHGPALYQARSPETCTSVRRMLYEAWRENLRIDNTGDECKAFVQQRLEQVPQAAMQDTLEAQLEQTLEALLRDETCSQSGGDAGPTLLPYWFLPTDWARLAEAYQVDFVLHGLPGTESRRCSYCGCAGHVHVGQRPPGIDLCLHVGWRGAGPERQALKDDTLKDSAAIVDGCKESNGAWGHWEPLGSGPVQSPLGRRNKADCDDTIDLTYPVCVPQVDNCAVEVAESTVDNRWSASIPGFSCVHVTSCTCQPAACQAAVPCQPGFARPCPKQLKDCRICPTDAERQASSDGFGDSEAIAPEEKAPSIATVVPVAAPSKTASQVVNSIGAGTRFSVLIAGVAADTTSGLDSEALTKLRSAFVQGVAATASISASRVRIVDVGLPLDFTARPRRQATSVHENSPGSKATLQPTSAGDSSPSSRAPAGESSPGSRPPATPTGSPKSPDTDTPDTGAGVLRFLGEEGAETPGPETPRVGEAQTDVPPAVSSEGTKPCPERSSGEGARAGGGVVRVLAMIREQRAEDAASSEEHDAMMALELVVSDLASTKSSLRDTIGQATDGQAQRIWCPEAEGPHKGAHRWPAAVARSRHAVTSARLRRARASRDS